jgi:hypothetical protein
MFGSWQRGQYRCSGPIAAATSSHLLGRVVIERMRRRGARCSLMWPTRANQRDGYRLGSYRIATAPEPNSNWLTSRKSICFDSPANNVGP